MSTAPAPAGYSAFAYASTILRRYDPIRIGKH